MKGRGLAGIVLLVGALATDARLRGLQEPAAECVVLTRANFETLAPRGKEVDALPGDYLLRNDRIIAVVANPVAGRDANSRLREVGGAVIDLTLTREPNDLLGVYRPGGNGFEWRSPVVEEGTSKKGGRRVSLSLHAEATGNRPRAVLTYALESGAADLEVALRVENPSPRRIEFDLSDRIRAEGPSFARVPEGDAPLAWFHDPWFGQAYGLIAPDVGMKVSHEKSLTRIRCGPRKVILEPGATAEFGRRIWPGRDRLDVMAEADRLAGTPLRTLQFRLNDAAGAPVRGATIALTRGGVLRGSGRTDDRGALEADVPTGRYRIEVASPGVENLVEEREIAADSGGGPVRVALEVPVAHTVTGRVTDPGGRPLPCRALFRGIEGTTDPDFGPVDATSQVKNVVYAADGRFTVTPPRGQYEVVITRGPEYDAQRRRVDTRAGSADIAIQATLSRSVDTPGWISADFHTHTTSSGDNVTSREGRILSLAAEGIEFAPSTEHNRIDSYRPVIAALGLEAYIATSDGTELTGREFAIAHQNAFPLIEKELTQGGGAPPVAPDPVAQIRGLARWDGGSEKLVQQNHPDLGWILNDRDGDRVPDEGYRGMLDSMDAVEAWNPALHLMRPLVVHAWETEETGPVRSVENNRAFNWLQLLNLGWRIPGTANTDAHDNYLSSGGVRNYVKASTDDPALIDPMEIVRSVEGGHVVMTNGPFIDVRLSAAGGSASAGPGDDIAVPHGRVRISVRVQCADWLDVDRVHVLVNGRLRPDLSFYRYNNPYRFRDGGPVRFNETFEFDLDRDAHIIVVAAHKAPLMLSLMGPVWGADPPVAITNPIFVDVDGGGFQASFDTLNYPLPVREGRVLQPGEPVPGIP